MNSKSQKIYHLFIYIMNERGKSKQTMKRFPGVSLVFTYPMRKPEIRGSQKLCPSSVCCYTPQKNVGLPQSQGLGAIVFLEILPWYMTILERQIEDYEPHEIKRLAHWIELLQKACLTIHRLSMEMPSQLGRLLVNNRPRWVIWRAWQPDRIPQTSQNRTLGILNWSTMLDVSNDPPFAHVDTWWLLVRNYCSSLVLRQMLPLDFEHAIGAASGRSSINICPAGRKSLAGWILLYGIARVHSWL